MSATIESSEYVEGRAEGFADAETGRTRTPLDLAAVALAGRESWVDGYAEGQALSQGRVRPAEPFHRWHSNEVIDRPVFARGDRCLACQTRRFADTLSGALAAVAACPAAEVTP